MKRAALKAFVTAVLMAVIFLIIGCEEQNLSNTKRHRLIADETIRLKRQLEQCNTEMEKQKQLLGQCLKEKKACQEKSQEHIDSVVEMVYDTFAEEKQKLVQKNAELEAQIEELKKELEGAKKQEGF